MSLPRVKRSVIGNLSQDQIPVLAKKVLAATTGVAKYDLMRTTLERLAERTTAYSAALLDAQDGGTKLVKIKNIEKTKLVAVLNKGADGFDYLEDGTNQIVLDSGMEEQQKSTRSTVTKQTPTRPKSVVVTPLAVEGKIKLKFELPNRKHTVMVAVEWQEVGSPIWHNGTYFTDTKGEVMGLPSGKEILVRIRSLGRYELKSSWTTSIIVKVF